MGSFLDPDNLFSTFPQVEQQPPPRAPVGAFGRVSDLVLAVRGQKKGRGRERRNERPNGFCDVSCNLMGFGEQFIRRTVDAQNPILINHTRQHKNH